MILEGWLLTCVLAAGEGPPLPAGHPSLDRVPQGSPMAQPSGTLPPGHPALTPGKEPPSSAELLKQLDATADLKQRDKSFDVAAALGKLYYSNGRFTEAATYLRQAIVKTDALRTFYVSEEKKAGSHAKLPSAASLGCVAASDAAMDALADKARAKAEAHEDAAAVVCAQAALRPVLDAESLLGDALFLTGDVKGALAEHQRVLTVLKDHPDSLYGHAGALLDSRGDDVPSLRSARADLTRYLQLYPLLPKAVQARKLLARADEALAAGGIGQLAKVRRAQHPTLAATPPGPGAFAGPVGPMMGGGAGPGAGGGPPPLTKDMVDAVQNTELTPEVLQGLAKLVEEGEDHLAHARFQDALDAYKRVVPFQPQNGRAKAGMAWALVGLNKPMGERIWQVAVGGDAAAVDKLGDTLAGKGDAAGAQLLWKKLASTDPAYAERASLAKKLK